MSHRTISPDDEMFLRIRGSLATPDYTQAQVAAIWHELDAERTAHMNTLLTMERLCEAVYEVENRGEPSLFADPGCIQCTAGVTPDRDNTGPCAYHAARNLLGPR